MASSYPKTLPNSNTWVRTQMPHSLSSPFLDFGYTFTSKSIPKNYNIYNKTTTRPTKYCALNSPSPLHVPKQPYQEPLITKLPPHLNFLQKAAATALDMIESAVVAHELRQPLPKTSDPKVQISGNFAPVSEQPVRHGLPVSGAIPACINGVYVRNGPNPFFHPVSGHHLFDGDGMIHAVAINSDTASYACRFTETYRLIQERQLGRPVFPKAIGELHGHSGIARLLLYYARGLIGLLDHKRGVGVANAGLVFFNNRLLALSEEDLPYQVTITTSNDLETVGRYDFNDQLSSAMIAHPKLDPVSGELFALSYDVIKKPYLKYFKFSASGDKSPEVEIPLEVPTMVHDFAITENFVVIPDQQVVFKLQEMIKGRSPVSHDKNKKSRFGILAKNAKNSKDIIYVESPDTFCFHILNAWEEEGSGEVVVIGSCLNPPDSIFNEYDDSLQSVLSEIRLNLKTGESTRRPIISSGEQINLEVGMVNKNKLGRKSRFAYLAIAEPCLKVSGFAKVDISTGDMDKYMYGDGRFGGEPLFLPKDSDGSDAGEDDGFILTLVHDEKTCMSELQIVNSVSLKLEATVKLPSRVPYGFHGTFVDAKQLANQNVVR